jgi:hypothetical protein
MQKDLLAVSPELSGSYGVGILLLEQPLRLFEWQGVKWTWALVLQQFSLYLAALVLIPVASVLFHGFREADYRTSRHANRRKGQTEEVIPGQDFQSEEERSDSRVHVTILSSVAVRDSFTALVLAEWRLMMKSASPVWLAMAAGLFILGLAVPAAASAEWMIWPVTWLWPLVLWSGMGSREARCGVQYLVASSPRYATRQLSALWISGVMLTCITGGGLLIRMLLEGDIGHTLNFAAAAILIPSLALACGVLTKGSRTFEVVYLMIWYLGPFNKMAYLNFLGSSIPVGNLLITNLVYLLISLGLLTAVYLSRRRLDQG